MQLATRTSAVAPIVGASPAPTHRRLVVCASRVQHTHTHARYAGARRRPSVAARGALSGSSCCGSRHCVRVPGSANMSACTRAGDSSSRRACRLLRARPGAAQHIGRRLTIYTCCNCTVGLKNASAAVATSGAAVVATASPALALVRPRCWATDCLEAHRSQRISPVAPGHRGGYFYASTTHGLASHPAVVCGCTASRVSPCHTRV